MRAWFLAVMVAVALPTAGQDTVLPWEVWKDPGVIARIRPDVRMILSSSVAPDGGPFDRHSEGDSRFIRVIDGEGVIFEAEGAGAVTRIWMTQGEGVSADLDEEIRLRVRIDGADDPVIDLSLPEFFGGEIPPFLEPMVLDRRRSGGGNVSYIPLPFRTGCRISLVGAGKAKIWFQVSATLLEKPDGVTSFTGTEDLSEWRRMLAHPGTDPWAAESGETVSGTVVLEPGEAKVLAAFDGPDQITGMVLRMPSRRLGEVVIRMSFDGQTTVNMPLPWFFGIGRPSCRPVRSLFIGGDQGEVYSYFPKPFHSRAEVEVELSSASAEGLKLGFAVRRMGRAPASDAALFNTQMIDVPGSVPGRDAVLLDLVGPGRLAGLAVTAGSTSSAGWAFLEGDETLRIDGEDSPSWRGTGVEDFFGGGFYFRIDRGRPGIFRQALHGMTCIGGTAERPSMSLYRLMPTDGPIFDRSLLFEVEGGPTGDVPVRWRGVAWWYGSKEQTRDAGENSVANAVFVQSAKTPNLTASSVPRDENR
ncbi:MAG: DUF2961 domain-containing protein [Acidobacteriota bacterium]